MGIDATGYIKCPEDVSDADIAKLNLIFLLFVTDFDMMGHDYFRRPRYDFENKRDIIEIDFGGWRHYGIGYERGPIMKIAAILGWSLRNLPGAKVYYGGDSFTLEDLCEWTLDREREVLDHFFKHGQRPYRDQSYKAGEGHE